jgi:hypothetical protein
MLKLRPHHISNIAQSFLTGFSDFEELFKQYGEQFQNYVAMIHASVIFNQSQRILIVSGLDDICENPYVICPKREEACSNSISVRDGLCQTKYGLVIGEVYSAAEVLSIARSFKEETGLDTPEEWLASLCMLDQPGKLLK